MNITNDHWLSGATRVPYPASSPMKVRRFLVIHFTSGATAMSSINFWKSPEAKGAEAHVIIDRDGTIYQVLPFNQRADHAGKSKWKDPNTGRLWENLNSCSIGIELANAGDDEKLATKWSKIPMHWGAHKNGGKPKLWEAYTPAQLAACEMISKVLVDRYNLDDVVGHDDIAPDRKVDPGPAFPMAALRVACGFPPALPRL